MLRCTGVFICFKDPSVCIDLKKYMSFKISVFLNIITSSYLNKGLHCCLKKFWESMLTPSFSQVTMAVVWLTRL